MQIKGTILDIGGKQLSGDQNQFSKQELTLDCTESYNGREYMNQLKFQFQNKNCDKLLNRKKGEEVTVEFMSRGRFYVKDNETKHFQTLDAWSITPTQQQPVGQPAAVHSHGAQNYPAGYNPSPENVDDLPF